MRLEDLRRELRSHGTSERAAHSRKYFKTGPGEYGAGDRFLGVRVPLVRKLARRYRTLSRRQTITLLRSSYHEERLLALLILVHCFERGDDTERERIYDTYLENTAWINSWDLVDCTAPHIVGAWLYRRDRRILDELAAAADLWRRRIAILATLYFIRHDDFDDALRLADRLLHDEHDLIHKAVGWMLREIGNRESSVAEGFLCSRYRTMPRTMLRYAIERFPEPRRQAYLKGTI